MRYFLNTRNLNKYATENNSVINIFRSAGYWEISKKIYYILEGIF
jgi:hypothetical protein